MNQSLKCFLKLPSRYSRRQHTDKRQAQLYIYAGDGPSGPGRQPSGDRTYTGQAAWDIHAHGPGHTKRENTGTCDCYAFKFHAHFWLIGMSYCTSVNPGGGGGGGEGVYIPQLLREGDNLYNTYLTFQRRNHFIINQFLNILIREFILDDFYSSNIFFYNWYFDKL